MLVRVPSTKVPSSPRLPWLGSPKRQLLAQLAPLREATICSMKRMLADKRSSA